MTARADEEVFALDVFESLRWVSYSTRQDGTSRMRFAQHVNVLKADGLRVLCNSKLYVFICPFDDYPRDAAIFDLSIELINQFLKEWYACGNILESEQSTFEARKRVEENIAAVEHDGDDNYINGREIDNDAPPEYDDEGNIIGPFVSPLPELYDQLERAETLSKAFEGPQWDGETIRDFAERRGEELAKVVYLKNEIKKIETEELARKRSVQSGRKKAAKSRNTVAETALLDQARQVAMEAASSVAREKAEAAVKDLIFNNSEITDHVNKGALEHAHETAIAIATKIATDIVTKALREYSTVTESDEETPSERTGPPRKKSRGRSVPPPQPPQRPPQTTGPRMSRTSRSALDPEASAAQRGCPDIEEEE